MGGQYGFTAEDVQKMISSGLLKPLPTVKWRFCRECRGSGNKYPEYIKNNSNCPKCDGRGVEEI